MKHFKKYAALISGFVSGLVFLASVNQPVMASWLGGGFRKEASPADIEFEPEKYCLEFFKKRDYFRAMQPCRWASKKDTSFYYYIAMAEYLSGAPKFPNLELLLDHLKEAKKHLEEKEDKEKLAIIYYALGTVLEKYGKELRSLATQDYQQIAIKYYEKALTLAEEANEKNIKAFVLTRLGEYYIEKNDLEKAEMYLERAVKEWGEVKRSIEFDENWINNERIRLYRSLGTLAYKKNNYTEAKENFKKVLDIARRHFNDQLYWYLNWYGVQLYRMGEYDEAEEYFKKAIRILEGEIRKIQTKRIQAPLDKIKLYYADVAVIYENLAETYIKKNDIARAKKSLLEANEKYKQLYNIMYDKGAQPWEKDLVIKKKEKNKQIIRQLMEITKQENKQDK
jgi:tetratricopeptide (TPR) repeat protein